jgi:hypothetical protein
MQRWFLPAQHRPAQPPEARLEGPVLLSPLPRPRLPIQRGPCRATRPAIQLHPAPWRQAPCRNNRPRLLPEEPTTRRRRSRPCRELQERHREHHRQPLRALHRRPDRPHRREAPHLAPLAPTTAQPLPAHPARPLRGALARREPSPNRGRGGKDTRSRWIVSAFDTGDSGTIPIIAQQRAMNGLHIRLGCVTGTYLIDSTFTPGVPAALLTYPMAPLVLATYATTSASVSRNFGIEALPLNMRPR